MMITDWDDAYDNRGHIAGAEDFPARWAAAAEAFRQACQQDGRAECDLSYGHGDREKLDLFHPIGPPNGLVIFAHGGYWKAFDKSGWSHLAGGALARGWAVAIPSYPLAPEARIAEITRAFAGAVACAAGRVDGPLRLAGHSAGGHLVCRMICEDTPLPQELAKRVERVMSISGVHDLRPLLRTSTNETLRLDASEAVAESPALNVPLAGAQVICWVGGDERPEFIRQTDLLANIWTGLDASMRSVHAGGKHHFTIIEDLAEADSALVAALTD